MGIGQFRSRLRNRMMPSSATPRSRPPHLLRLLVALGLACFAGIRPGPAGAAETAAVPARGREETKRFDISAGDAFTTLRHFSVQSGEQLIYQADSLEGVRTDAVRGRYTAREALGRMLIRTALAVTQDSRTGTLAITRIPRPGERNTPGPRTADHSATVQKKKPQP